MSGLVVADDWISGLPVAVQARISSRLHPRQLPAGVTLVAAGSPAAAIHRVAAGFIKQTAIGEDGERRLLTLYAAGACFAETAVIAGLPHNHTAVALTDARAESLPTADFWRLYAAHPEIANALCRKFAGAIRRQVADREERVSTRLRGRIARLFDDLAAAAGVAEPDGRLRVDLPITQLDLAAHLGLTRQSIQRELGAFGSDRSIERLPRGWLVNRHILSRWYGA